jgi:hypothetical protein
MGIFKIGVSDSASLQNGDIDMKKHWSLSILLCSVLMSSLAQAQGPRPVPQPLPPQQGPGGGPRGQYEQQAAIQKARELSIQVARNAPYMRRDELRRLNALLDQAAMLVQGGSQGYPPQPPSYPPAPSSSVCKILGRGQHGGWTYDFRIAINGQTLEGSNDLNAILARLEQLQRDRMCVLQAAQDICQLLPRGQHAGWTRDYRAALNGEAISGSDRLEEALSVMANLERAGVCRVAASGACQLLGRGQHGGWTYDYLLGIGSQVYAGSNRYEDISTLMNTLRASRVCY